MKDIITSGYVFNHTTKTIDFTNVPFFEKERLTAIINNSIPAPNVIYSSGGESINGGTFTGDVLQLNITTAAGVSSSDFLQIFYESEQVGIDRENNKLIIGGARDKSRDNFDTKDTSKWSFNENVNDVFGNDGTSLGASYYRITKGLVADTESSVVSNNTIMFPIMATFGLSLSQRIVGQEIALELVGINDSGVIDNEATPTDLTIVTGTVSVTSNIWTINTTTNHNLQPNDRIAIYNSEDSRLNIITYITAIISPTQITVTSTLGNGTYTVGSTGRIRKIDGFDFAKNGAGFLFENATATQATIQVKQGGKSVLPAIAQTVGTTVATPTTPAFFSEQFTTATNFEVYPMINEIMFRTYGSDSLSSVPTTFKRTQGTPTPDFKYKLRVRATNLPNLTVPIARIVSIAKTGTTTATVTTDIAHGLTINSFVQIYGVRDITNFPNLTAQTQVATVPTTTTFTIVIGSASTNTSTNSGIVALVHGGSLLPAINFNIQSASRTLDLITFVLNTTITGVLVGEMFEVAGCDLNVSGENFNGKYKILSVSTTNIVVRKTGADFTTTNCGGTFIKLTDVRLHYVRNMEHTRTPVEIYGGKTAQDENNSVPVKVVGATSTSITSGTVSTVTNITNTGTPTVPATTFFLNSAASTNGALIITGSSGLGFFYATNIGATVAYVKLYNKATAPTVGTDSPEMTIPIPAAVAGVAGATPMPSGFNGARFPLGLGIAITGAYADTDTTAVALNQVKVKISRTI